MPTKIGRFELLSEIAKSESGSVYKASDAESGQTVALKTLRLDSLAPEQAADLVQQVMQEAETARVLNSPNLTPVYGASESEGMLYAAMEYVQGNSVGTMLARKEGFSIWDLLDISRQACQGLDHAHSHQVAHSSLEPDKVMVSWDGTVKILDFGISSMGSSAAQAAGRAPTILYYMSPEQLRGEPLDGRSNLFSWGAILYEMVTERKAFEGEDADSVRQKILEEMPTPPVHIHPKVHPALSDVIMKALAKSPEERYQSGQELVNDLEKCKESASKATAKKAAPAQGLNVPKAAAPATPRPAPSAVAPVKPQAKVPEKPIEAAKAPVPKPMSKPAEPRHAATKAAAAGLAGGASTTVSSPAEPVMSAAETVEEMQSPGIAVDPMMAEEKTGGGHGPSFSEIEELPPLKEVYVAPPPPPPADLPEPQAPILVTPPEPPRPKPQPRQVARKAVKEIRKTPPRLFVYSMTSAVAIILLVVVGIAYHIHSQNAEDEDVAPPPATSASSTPAPAPAAPAQAAPQPAPETVQAEPEPAQPEVTVTPKFRGRRKPAAPAAPVIVPGQLTVNSTPEGAQLQVDGRSEANWVTPYNLTGLAPGQHTVVVSRAGFASETRTVDVTSGGKLFLVVQLAQVLATLSVTSQPAGAHIFVNGKDTGHVTPAQVSAEKGSHVILIRKDGYLDETATANVAPGQTFHFAPVLRALGTTEDIKIAGRFKKLFGGGDTSGMGAVSIKTQPKGAQVAVNRRIVEKPTPVQFYLNPGNYEIDITSSGYKPIHRVINVEKGGKLSFEDTLEHE